MVLLCYIYWYLALRSVLQVPQGSASVRVNPNLDHQQASLKIEKMVVLLNAPVVCQN